MTDKPILFSGPMVQAIIDGRKTQTRRVVKLADDLVNEFPTGHLVNYYGDRRLGMSFWGTTRVQPIPYAIGDRLWVREVCWLPQKDDYSDFARNGLSVAYRATDDDEFTIPPRWRSPIHMPRWASRLTLIVTDVRVQQVQEISDREILAEGCPITVDQSLPKYPRAWFHSLWDDLNQSRGRGWHANPWVVALTFTVHRQNIDQMGEAA